MNTQGKRPSRCAQPRGQDQSEVSRWSVPSPGFLFSLSVTASRITQPPCVRFGVGITVLHTCPSVPWLWLSVDTGSAPFSVPLDRLVPDSLTLNFLICVETYVTGVL